MTRFESAQFSELLGKTLTKVERVNSGERREELHFYTDDGFLFLQGHDQDCCESVGIEDICGALEDLIGSPILVAVAASQDDPNPADGIGMWTFYKLATVKGWVDIRWYGESNGYYSVDVDTVKTRLVPDERKAA